jgi:hypothetical protein
MSLLILKYKFLHKTRSYKHFCNLIGFESKICSLLQNQIDAWIIFIMINIQVTENKMSN